MQEQESLTDHELIQFCIEGKRLYQEMLYRKYAPKMLRICLGYTNSREEAKDILQDSFIKVFDSIKKFNGEGSLEGWMREQQWRHLGT